MRTDARSWMFPGRGRGAPTSEGRAGATGAAILARRRVAMPDEGGQTPARRQHLVQMPHRNTDGDAVSAIASIQGLR
jgi:hypothetical protein